ncbi:MAG: hypothetical protein KGL39_12595 [Patescibacteria group bacterium]|nr:hypothetical protein [Patescibacteria group bacterium]
MSEKKSDSSIDSLRTFYEVKEADLKSKLTDLNERYKYVVARLKEADDRLNAIMGLRDTVEGSSPKHFSIKAARHGEATAFAVASDWHLEERIDPETVNGVNEYNPQIAESRIEKFFSNVLSVTEMCRTRSKIETLVLCVLGDLITNKLHEDQAESNYLSPTEASLKAYRLLCGGINFLLTEGKFKRLLIPCLFGNHGRTTKKLRVSTAAQNSYEWMIYHLVAERYANDSRVQFSIANGYFNFLDCYGIKFRLHHGDDVRYQGGVGGVEIPLNKAIAQWNKMNRVDIDILGHWHTRKIARDFVINGSTIGYGPYSIFVKASYEPPCQCFFLVHPEYGKTVEVPIFVK